MGVSGRSAGKWLPAHSPSSQAALTPRRPHPHSLAACAPPANPEELQAVRERRVGPACRTRKGRKTEREGTLAILLMYKRTKVRPCVVRPCWVALLGDVNRRCPEDDLAPTRLLPAQPLEVLEHRPISCHNPIRIRSEVPADPTLNSRDHFLPFLSGGRIGRSVRCYSPLNIGKTRSDLGAIRFGIGSSFGVVTVDTAMQCEATTLPLLLREKVR